ncbi:pyruvate carboxylase subunit B, partial [Myxococcota bacterium]|nr:pyruvate carboxylase subunit B [Myxococcota bacterium]MBU1536226.1 pyruvate carboxylase subunit B [Myxococcota bacterium]
MIKITETILRDAHQSLIATRMRLEDMIPALEMLDAVGYHSLEMWGGATFDSCLRFLNEDPWERLVTIRKHVKKTKLQMLLRGQNVVGYRHYADDVVTRFVELAAKNGIDIFRVFDALNDMRNIEFAMKAVKKTGKHLQGCISYTLSPVHTEEIFIKFAKDLKGVGADSIAIKDMAGLLSPAGAFSLVKKLKQEVGLPVQVHTHCTSGLAMMTYFMAAQAGADVLDCALSPLSWGTSQPPTESIVHGFRGTEWDSGIDPAKFKDLTTHFKKVREKYASLISPISERLDVDVLQYQIPGGMLSNLVSQLEKQKKLDRYDEVLLEVPRVRKELGYPPLVTPTSQIVGTQAVMNIIAGARYKMITEQTKDLVRGKYGRTPAPISDEIKKQIIGDEKVIEGRPADSLEHELPVIREKYAALIKKPEDEVSLALYADVAAKFLRGEGEAEALPSDAPAVAAVEKAPQPSVASMLPAAYDVTVNGKNFHVNVVPAGQGVTVATQTAQVAQAPTSGSTGGT